MGEGLLEVLHPDRQLLVLQPGRTVNRQQRDKETPLSQFLRSNVWSKHMSKEKGLAKPRPREGCAPCDAVAHTVLACNTALLALSPPEVPENCHTRLVHQGCQVRPTVALRTGVSADRLIEQAHSRPEGKSVRVHVYQGICQWGLQTRRWPSLPRGRPCPCRWPSCDRQPGGSRRGHQESAEALDQGHGERNATSGIRMLSEGSPP